MKRFLSLPIVFLLTAQFAFADIIIGNPLNSNTSFAVTIQAYAPTGQSETNPS
jgi:hypothetical protein